MSTFDFPVPIAPTIPADVEFDSARINSLAPVETIGAYTPWKIPVKAATTANITLSGLQTIDTVVLTAGERVLVKDQTTASEDGIYIVSSTVWPRAEDLEPGVSAAGTGVYVTAGDANLNNLFICTNVSGSDIVGTDDLVFAAAAYDGNLALNDGNIFVGNGSNVATGVSPSGDVASISNTGTFTLSNTGVTAGSYTSADITVDSKGRITLAANGSGGVGGSNTQVQFNNAGSIDGSPYFTFDPSVGTVTIAGLPFDVYGLTSFGTTNENPPAGNFETGMISGVNAALTSDLSGGALIVKGGDGDTSGAGGILVLTGGNANGTSNNGAPVNIYGGLGGSAAGDSAGVNIFGRDGVIGAGGEVAIVAGTPGSTSSDPGANVTIQSGNGASGAASDAGDITLTGGSPGFSGNGGNILLTGGTGDNGGNITLTSGSGINDGVVDIVTGGVSAYTNTIRDGGLLLVKGVNPGVTFGGSVALNASSGGPWQGTVTVTTTAVISGVVTITMPTSFTTSNMIFLTVQGFAGTTETPYVYVSAKTAGTSFAITVQSLSGLAFTVGTVDIAVWVV